MTRRASVAMVELESQDAATMNVASAKHVTATVALRVGAAVASLAAAVLVVTNRQERWGVEVNFTMFDVWVAFVATNFFCTAYSLLTAIFVKKLIGKRWLHTVDQLVVNLQTAATAGAGAIGSVAMWGNKTSGWYAVCRLYRRYCDVGAVALALSFAAFLSLGSACALSRYPRAPARH
ncbi:hypothetical protein VPH35_122996 [Triticum aestivum]|uniref:CASP-like protein n=2 Tax=Triticum TaxID=4564 RepID=A0A9R1BMS5_TRITD|nr:CASP-like protein UU-1 [Triticum aestivum]VAI74479.1 unnamed protein product [Triticum turgidum subsp. durum]